MINSSNLKSPRNYLVTRQIPSQAHRDMQSGWVMPSIFWKHNGLTFYFPDIGLFSLFYIKVQTIDCKGSLFRSFSPNLKYDYPVSSNVNFNNINFTSSKISVKNNFAIIQYFISYNTSVIFLLSNYELTVKFVASTKIIIDFLSFKHSPLFC